MSNERKTFKEDILEKAFDAAKDVGRDVISKADSYLEGEYDPRAEAKKTVVKGTTTALVVLSLLSGLAFSGPADINQDSAGSNYNQPPIVMEIDDYANTEVDDEDDADEQKGSKSGAVSKFRQAVLSLPSSVRLILITPLWALGTALMTTVSFLWTVLFSSPLGAFIASFAVGFAVLFGLFAITAKMLFPNIPLRKLLSKRNILVLGIAALLLSIIDAWAPNYWHQYPAVAAAVKLCIGVFVIGVISYRINKILHRDKYENMPAPTV